MRTMFYIYSLQYWFEVIHFYWFCYHFFTQIYLKTEVFQPWWNEVIFLARRRKSSNGECQFVFSPLQIFLRLMPSCCCCWTVFYLSYNEEIFVFLRSLSIQYQNYFFRLNSSLVNFTSKMLIWPYRWKFYSTFRWNCEDLVSTSLLIFWHKMQLSIFSR